MKDNTPKDSSRNWIFRRAIAVAIVLTAVMAVCGTIANLVRPLSWLHYVSLVIAFPPSLIVRHLLSINGGSMAGVIVAELEGVVFTLIFYTLLAAVVFWAMNRQTQK
jgi:hypothetical protein